MRFKRGCQVEVMIETNRIISWKCAVIVSGYKDTYTVKLDCDDGNVFQRVSSKYIRPCPPSTAEDIELRFVAGNVLEVLHHGSWLIATFLNVFNMDWYSVRLLGSSKELTVHKSRIRVRLSWKDGKWVNVRQGSEKTQRPIPNKFKIKQNQMKNDILPFKDYKRFQKKVDDGFSYPKEKSGEKGKRYFSFKNDDDNDDACSVACSVGSCSVFDGNSRNGLREDNEKIVGDKVHSLEKYAYRSTLEALYASGPFSWEKADMLTDLRVTLHISTDEHLVELRNLTSWGPCFLRLPLAANWQFYSCELMMMMIASYEDVRNSHTRLWAFRRCSCQ